MLKEQVSASAAGHILALTAVNAQQVMPRILEQDDASQQANAATSVVPRTAMVMAHVSKSVKQPDVLVSQASPMMVLSNVQNAKTLCSSTQIATSAPGSWMNLMSAVRISSIECHELSGRAQVVLATARLPTKDQHYKAQTASSTGPGDTASWMARLLEREAHTTSWCLLALSSVYSSTQVALELWRDTDSLILSLRSS